MKLPRWLVIVMLTSSVLTPLAAAGWWWVTWPERTAREFVALVGTGRLDEAERMVRVTPGMPFPRVLLQHSRPEWNQANLGPGHRTLSDLALARQDFEIPPGCHVMLTVERGTVVDGISPVAALLVKLSEDRTLSRVPGAR